MEQRDPSNNSDDWDVADEFDGCYECGAPEKTPLCSLPVWLVARVNTVTRTYPLNLEKDAQEVHFMVSTAMVLKCYHAWKGRRFYDKRKEEGRLLGDLNLDPSPHFMLYPKGEDYNATCAFCDAKVHLKDLRYHFDENDLCGLRKTTLLGMVITYLKRTSNEDNDNPHCGEEVQRDWLIPVCDKGWMTRSYKGDLALSTMVGKYPFRKTVEFNDEPQLREKYKYLQGTPRVERKKELNPTKHKNYNNQ
jgi:hypothetical protein